MEYCTTFFTAFLETAPLVYRNKKIEIVNGIKLDSLVDGYIASSICNIDRKKSKDT